MTLRIFSCGWGTQSVGILVLQALGKLPLPYDYYVFANVGDDSENPETLEYIEKWGRPFAEQHGIKTIDTQKTYFGKPDTLYQALMRDNRSVEIPMYMGDTGAPGNRSCTEERKINVVDIWAHDAMKADEAIIGIGVSIDEIGRVRGTDWHQSHVRARLRKRREYQLIQLQMSRMDCASLILSVGLPLPPKSSCWFCPFHRPNEWIEIKRNTPDLFAKAIAVEKRANEKRANLGKDSLYLHRSLKPLDQAVGNQLSLFDNAQALQCDEGVCDV